MKRWAIYALALLMLAMCVVGGINYVRANDPDVLFSELCGSAKKFKKYEVLNYEEVDSSIGYSHTAAYKWSVADINDLDSLFNRFKYLHLGVRTPESTHISSLLGSEVDVYFYEGNFDSIWIYVNGNDVLMLYEGFAKRLVDIFPLTW